MEGFIDRIGVWRYGVLMEWLPLELVLMLDGHSRWRCSWLLMLDVPGPWMKARGESCNGFFPPWHCSDFASFLSVYHLKEDAGRPTSYFLAMIVSCICTFLLVFIPTFLLVVVPPGCGCTS